MSLTIRIEEIPTVGAIELKAFNDDKADFVDFSGDYDGTFQTDWSDKNTALGEIVTTRFHIGKIANHTALIKASILEVFPLLDPLERYLNKAKALLIVPEKLFGITEVRVAARSLDAELLDGKLLTLIQNITSNFTALEGKGYKDTEFVKLKDLKLRIFNLNTEQESWKYDKEQAVEENLNLFDEVLDIIKDVQKTGKVLYKRINKAKALEYTMTDILNKIRQDMPPAVVVAPVPTP